MTGRFLTLVVLSAFCFLAAPAQESIQIYKDRNSFSVATRDIVIHDFEGIVPSSGFKHYQREGELKYAGAEFRPGGGARFGPGPVIVVGSLYQGGPAYETTSGAKLQWAPPNQPGNAYLDVKVGSATAVGLDFWTVQPLQSMIEVTVTTADGKTRTETVPTPARPAAAFVGFTSDAGIVSMRLTPPKGQTGLIVDNFSVGKSRGISSAESANAAKPRPVTESSGAISESVSRPSTRTPPLGAGSTTTAGSSSGGTIAYVRNSTEIRLISPDGSNDRRLWTHADLRPTLGIFELAWKPDGTELAFSSAHEAVASPYMADIYSIRRDGSGLHRLTNAPDRSDLGRFPKGSVTVNVHNGLSKADSPANFIVYVVGADDPQQVAIAPGAIKAVEFKSVADFGRQPQMLVAMSGNRRWFVPGVDVVPGKTVSSPILPISGEGYEMHGAFRPAWRADGSKISFRSGLCIVSSAPSTPVAGSTGFNPFFSGDYKAGTCAWDWGPTAATADQIIYAENSTGSFIYQMTEGGRHPGTKLTAYSDLSYQHPIDLHWISDGSGLLYSTLNTFRDSSNIFRYDFATKRTTQVTKLDKAFAREFSVSPDGRSVVFQQCPDRDAEAGCDLWTIGIDGGGARLLVKDGLRPAWGR